MCSHKATSLIYHIKFFLQDLSIDLYILALESTERIDQYEERGEFQLQRYVPFSRRYDGPRSTLHRLHQSTSAMMVPFSCNLSLPTIFPGRRVDDVDGIDHLMGGERRWARGRWWYKLAHVFQRSSGKVSYMCQHTTWALPLSVQMTRPQAGTFTLLREVSCRAEI